MRTLISFSIILVSLFAYAQKDNSFSILKFNDVSIDKVAELNAIKQKPNRPFRFGIPIKKDIYFDQVAQKTATDSGAVQLLTIQYDHAVNLSLILSGFDLIENEQLMISGEFESYKFTSTNATFDKRLGTSEITGDSLSIILWSERSTNLIIEQVIFGFKSPSLPTSKGNTKLNTSGDCHYDINCPEGSNWVDQKKGIVRISLGGSICSGSMINNELNDGTPFFLTANHCLSAFPDVSTWVFRFDYESSIASCNSGAPSSEPNQPFLEINGAQLRSRNNKSDFCLLELNSRPSSAVFYNGWERIELPNTEVTSIHHPDGDVKKISGSSELLENEIFEGVTSIKIPKWTYGTTEGGSSGAPLFNSSKLIVGQLYGGFASCSSEEEDYYGSFFTSWNDDRGDKYRLKDWLDIRNTDALKIQGNYIPFVNLDLKISNITNIDPIVCNTNSITPKIELINLGQTNINSVEFEITSSLDTIYFTKMIDIPSGKRSSVILDTIFIQSSCDTIQATILKVNSTTDDIIENNTMKKRIVNYQNVMQGEIRFKTDCFGSESSWDLYNTTKNKFIVGGGPYTDFSFAESINTPICLPSGCYRLDILDSYGDGLTGGDFGSCNENGGVTVLLRDSIVTELLNIDFNSKTSLNFCINSDSSVITPIPDNTTKDFLVFPNPFSDNLMITNDSNDSLETQILIYSLTGDLVFDLKHNFKPLESSNIITTTLSSGSYIIHLQSNNNLSKHLLTKY